jgi:CrcB protein
MSLSTLLLVMFGGAVGTLARYLLSYWALPISETLPIGTLVINMLGSFAIGFFGTLTLSEGRFPVSENIRLFVMVGLCGGFTTFSAFNLQTLDFLRNGAAISAAINVTASVVLCVAAVAAGHYISARFNHGATQIAQLPIEEEA